MHRNNSSSSPYRGRASLIEKGHPDDEVYLRSVIRTLQSQKILLQQELTILRTKTKKVVELEEKVDMVLEHNSKLIAENQRLNKLIHQKKSEVQVWRNKYENQAASRHGQAANHQLEIKKLLNQMERLKDQCAQIQHIKNIEINDIKNKHQLQIQNIKRTHLSNTQIFELEIRKLKQSLQKKEYQIEQSGVKINRLYNQSQFQTMKLKEEKDRLRTQISYLQIDKKKELDSLRLKIQNQFNNELQNIKKNHHNHIDTLDYQNLKLKEVINSKNAQIENLINKNQKLKQSFQETNSILKRENDCLKQKFCQTEKISQVEIETLKEKLQNLHDSEIEVLKKNHNNLVQALRNQIDKMQVLLRTKDLEIENLLKEKQQKRLSHQAYVNQLNSELEIQKNKYLELQTNYKRQVQTLLNKVKAKEKRILEIQSNAMAERNRLNQDIAALRELFQKKSIEYDSLKKSTDDKIRNLENQLSSKKQQFNDLQQDYIKMEESKNKELQILQNQYQTKIAQNKEVIKRNQDEIKDLKTEINKNKESLKNKEAQTHKLKSMIETSTGQEEIYKNRVEELQQRILNNQKDYNKIIAQQKNRMQDSFKYQIKNLQSDHTNQIKSLHIQIDSLKQLLEKKDSQLDELLKKFKLLQEKFYELANQQSLKKQIDIKFPGAIPSVISAKDLFDVYLKAKLLSIP